MLIAFADFPEDLRKEILTMIRHQKDHYDAQARTSTKRKDIAPYKFAVGALRHVEDDLERLKIFSTSLHRDKKEEVTSGLTVPTINLNGGDPNCMIKYIVRAMDTLTELTAQMCEIHPHGRDYQTAPEPDKSFNKAVEEHRARCAAIMRIHTELMHIALYIKKQQPEKGPLSAKG